MTLGNRRTSGKISLFPVAFLIFALIFCAIQLPATYESVCQFFGRTDWPQLSAEVIRAEYLGKRSDGGPNHSSSHTEWQLYVSYEYEDEVYESKYPSIKKAYHDEHSEDYIGERIKIIVNPDNPMEIGRKVEVIDLVFSVGFSILFVMAVIFGFKMVFAPQKKAD